MSLTRFYNFENLLTFARPEFGQVYDPQGFKLIDSSLLLPNDTNISQGVVEAHLYSFYGDYLKSSYNVPYMLPSDGTSTITVDIRKLFAEAAITRGSFRVAINVHQNLFGTAYLPSVVAQEISPDRTEVKFGVHTRNFSSVHLTSLKDQVSSFQSQNLLNLVNVNFGSNELYSVVNIRFDQPAGVVYVKFNRPLADTLQPLDVAWFCYPITDCYVDAAVLVNPVVEPQPFTLRGPNFDVSSDDRTSNATTFQTWDQLLDSDLPTTQGIINSVLSGSGETVRLNIDYTDFANFIFYSSAKERLDIFKAKVEQLEYYDAQISQLFRVSGSTATGYVQANVDTLRKRQDAITSNLDPFEKWLWYETTASIFTHDFSGSMTPWPKQFTGSAWVPYTSSTAIAVEWFATASAVAEEYDRGNINRLYWSIPEHVLMDAGNSDYIMFVEMVATHFDNLHTYVKALTEIHSKDEHPKRGTAAELLYHVARSYGWHLQDVRQLSSLWLYKLGTDQSGSMQFNGDLEVAPHEQQSKQIWKRTINSLPYLLKTKGTSRSIKALMNIYGIPQTLLSIKEYGGPNIETFKPTFIEDRFSYALNFDGQQYVKIRQQEVPPSSGSWGGVTRSPDSLEFRFNTSYSGSGAMNLLSVLNDGNLKSTLSIHHASTFAPFSQSYSGSLEYGYLVFTSITGSSGGVRYSSSISSSALPLYDKDFWTVRIYANEPITGSNTRTPLTIEVASTKDYALGEIVHSSSFVWNSDRMSDMANTWGMYTQGANCYVVLGGDTGSTTVDDKELVPLTTNRFSGSIQGYKDYFTLYTAETFHSHVLNPGAYHTDSSSGSYYYLYRYFPLGLDVQRWDHTTFTAVSSSQPNRSYGYLTTASFVGFTGSEQSQYTSVKERYYIYAPTIGGQSLRSEKVRIEDTTLDRALSLTKRNAVGSYDKAAFDSNRLAIVFSLADQVNRDIFNHMGFHDLDYLVAGARYEFESDYPELRLFRQEYFKKYTQINNINSFIDILSLYDYTFFEQIRQLVPGRADLIAGILVEPHVLEKSKVQLAKRPKVENPQWDTVIGYSVSQSGEYIGYEAAIDWPTDLEITQQYYTGSVDLLFDFSVEHEYFTGSIERPFTLTMQSIHHVDPDSTNTGMADTVDCLIVRYSGSSSETGSIVDEVGVSNYTQFSQVIYHYSGAGDFPTRYEREWAMVISQSMGWAYSSSLVPTHYQYPEDSTENLKRFVGCKLTGPDFNVNSPNTIDGGPVIEVYEVNPNTLSIKDDPRQGNLVVE